MDQYYTADLPSPKAHPGFRELQDRKFSDTSPDPYENSLSLLEGYPSTKFSGIDNPAFRNSTPEPTSPLPTSNERSLYANHLIFDTSRSSSSREAPARIAYSGNKRMQKYATTRQVPVYFEPWGGLGNRSFYRSQSLGPNTVPISQIRTYMGSSVGSHVPNGGAGGAFVPSDEDAGITFFDLVTDKVSSYQYRPGEEVSGTINIVARKGLAIRFVELVVSGKGHVVIRKTPDALPQTIRETYLRKQKYVIGSGDYRLTSFLTPGHYASKFKIQLPKDLPSTLKYKDLRNGFSFDVAYVITARICDDLHPVKGFTSQSRVRVLRSKQIHFNVQRSFDLASISESRIPLSHTEQVYLSCAHEEPAVVSVNLERAVYLAGDDIRLQLHVSLPSSQRLKEIKCVLHGQVTLEPRQEPVVMTMAHVVSKDEHESPKAAYDVIIPTQTDLLTSYHLGGSQIKVAYYLTMKVKFTPAGGKMIFKVPVVLGPCAEPIYAEKTSSRKMIPIFTGASRFPHFSQREPPKNHFLQARSLSAPPMTPTRKVVTTYNNGVFSRCFLCCCPGFGKS
ncbi:unnamed protein product [Lymnaea stagnalis]|uniref:Arrestin C-terminal-like domain-containing protein n=1 Tax=Lymnaea stagnalis TaxID=6523 RepID=A0AAV2IP35_LYMST